MCWPEIENTYIISLKDIKPDRKVYHLFGWKELNILKISILPKLIYQCNAVSIRISADMADMQFVHISSTYTRTPLSHQISLKKNISSKIKVLKFQDDVNRVLNHMYMYEVDLAIRTTIFKMETFPWQLFFWSVSWSIFP